MPDRKPPGIEGLCQRLAHQFNNPALLRQALTHRSHGAENNERLEFLGDSILNFCIGERLYERFQQAPEGDLSRLRAAMVKGETLAAIARELELSECLRLGEGEARSGGYQRSSILADALEAIIGAIYLDAGMDAAKKEVLRWFDSRLADLSVATSGKDPKTRLQELMQAQGKPLPQYTITEVAGQPHAQVFTVKCTVATSATPTLATAGSRRAAEKDAARKMLAQLEQAAG